MRAMQQQPDVPLCQITEINAEFIHIEFNSYRDFAAHEEFRLLGRHLDDCADVLVVNAVGHDDDGLGQVGAAAQLGVAQLGNGVDERLRKRTKTL